MGLRVNTSKKGIESNIILIHIDWRMGSESINDVLYPKIEPYATGMLPVSERHTIAWECAGNPDGIPVIVIHGGPGGGSQP
ncbi:MAG: hypothetical protein VXV85_03215, partial [Candidatus Thermoplasmatota archaeon]|nr:hypothetical protein [Candidatus Thermoplasmatota archaeon]